MWRFYIPHITLIANPIQNRSIRRRNPEEDINNNEPRKYMRRIADSVFAFNGLALDDLPHAAADAGDCT